jgi:hypothetical protein
MKWNSYMNNHFGGCRVVQRGHDPHRNRAVTVYALPGEFELVGITDTCESWIAPVNVGFLQQARRNLDRLRQGLEPVVDSAPAGAHSAQPRTRVKAQAAAPQPTQPQGGTARVRVRIAV